MNLNNNKIKRWRSKHADIIAGKKMAMWDIIDVLRFDNNSPLWNHKLADWTISDWGKFKELQKKQKESKVIIA